MHRDGIARVLSGEINNVVGVADQHDRSATATFDFRTAEPDQRIDIVFFGSGASAVHDGIESAVNFYGCFGQGCEFTLIADVDGFRTHRSSGGDEVVSDLLREALVAVGVGDHDCRTVTGEALDDCLADAHRATNDDHHSLRCIRRHGRPCCDLVFGQVRPYEKRGVGVKLLSRRTECVLCFRWLPPPGVGIKIVVVDDRFGAFDVGGDEDEFLIAKHEACGATFERWP